MSAPRVDGTGAVLHTGIHQYRLQMRHVPFLVIVSSRPFLKQLARDVMPAEVPASHGAGSCM
jgi:hypothetical protein